ncbi:MAG: HesA/MoeB/ThiF family protein [Acidiferrobacteraceae bacterium]
MNARSSRQSFLGADSERLLAESRVALIGIGGGGSHIAQQLAHIGIGDLLIIDPDPSEETNINRLIGATYEDVVNGQPKTVIAEKLIRGIHPTAQVIPIPKDWREAAHLLRDRDVIFGSVDDYATRRDLEIVARRYLIPYIDIGMDVHSDSEHFRIEGQVILSMPGRPCLHCLGFLREDLLAKEAARYGNAGSKPQVVWPNGVLASCAVGVFMQLITPWHDAHQDVVYLEYDGNNHSIAPSTRLRYVHEIVCPHFTSAGDLGDPFWVGG